MPPSTTGQWTGAFSFVISDQPLRDDAHPPHTIIDDRGLFVLHAVLLHTGKVLCFGGHVETAYYPPLSYVFDPDDPGALMTPIPFPAGMDLFCCHYVQLPNGRILVVGGSDKDFMGHSSHGANNICFFEPSTSPPFGRWVNTGNDMIHGRWYPTPVLLPDGRVIVVSGRRELTWVFLNTAARIAAGAYRAADIDKIAFQRDTGTYWRLLSTAPTWAPISVAISDKVEILSPPHRKSKEQIGATKQLPIYPGLHLAPNGKVYWTGTTWGQEIPNPVTASIEIPPDPATSTPWTVSAGTPPTQPRREEGMSVLLPLTGGATDGQILVIGGTTALRADSTSVMQGAGEHGSGVFHHVAAPSDALSADILDTSVDPPDWSAAPTMNFGHTNGHCILLPDETVLVCGGHNNYKWRSAAGGTRPTLEAELFTPGGSFARLTPTTAEPNDRMHVPRMYHSVALLLPDGRVWVAGGANPNAFEPTLTYPVGWTKPTYGAGMPHNDKTWEFFEPPYYFKPDRASQPEIDDVVRGGSTTRRLKYGSAFKIKTRQAASIDPDAGGRVAIMRPGAPTHHTDTEQRYVQLKFTQGTNELNVTMESDKKKAPPGFYMLWIIDSSKRPCKLATFIHVVA